ncbi:MAG: hypothetical protein WKF35_10930 [Ferruginibacter sp.]
MVKKLHHIFLIICFTGILPLITCSQTVEVSLNKNAILIGEQVSFGLKVKLPPGGYKARFSIPDSIVHFEIIRKGEIKSVKGETALEQVITFTSFDSGNWYFPALPVLITDGARKSTLFSDSVLIKVGYSPADSSGVLRDIKPVMDVIIVDYTIWYIIGGGLLLLLLLYLLYRYLKKRKNKPVPLFKSDLTAYDEAIKSLLLLEQGNLLNVHKEKEYHTELADIFKRYYSRTMQKNLLNKTTGDILVELKENDTSKEHIGIIAEGLRYTDAVKFAKFIPLHAESKSALDLIRQGIQSLEKKSPLK